MNAKYMALGGAAIAALAVFVGLDMRDDQKFRDTTTAGLSRIDRIEKTVSARLTTMQNIDARVAQRLKTIEGLEQAVVGSADTVEALEKSVSRRLDAIAGLEKSVSGRVKDVSGLEETLSRRVDGLQGALKDLDKKIADLGQRMDAASARGEQLAEIDGRLNAVDALLADLAGRLVRLETAPQGAAENAAGGAKKAELEAKKDAAEEAALRDDPKADKAGKADAADKADEVETAEIAKRADDGAAAKSLNALPPAAGFAAEEAELLRLTVGETLKVRDNQLFLSRLTETEAYFIIDFAERANLGVDLKPIELASGCAVRLREVAEGAASLAVDCG